MTFHQDILKFTQTVEKRLRATVIQAAGDLAEKIVRQTPIDLPFGWHDPESVGYARGGWFVTFDGISKRQNGALDPLGDATIANIRKGLQNYRIRTHTTIHLNNNVPYIGVLEFGGYQDFVTRLKSTDAGFSTQAPAGMARLHSFMWPTFVTKAVATSRMV